MRVRVRVTVRVWAWVRVEGVLGLVEREGLCVVHGRLLVVVLLEGVVALVLTVEHTRGVPALRGLLRLHLGCRGGARLGMAQVRVRVRVMASVGVGVTAGGG